MIIEKGSQLKKISFSPPSHYIKNANYQILIIYKKWLPIPLRENWLCKAKRRAEKSRGTPDFKNCENCLINCLFIPIQTPRFVCIHAILFLKFNQLTNIRLTDACQPSVHVVLFYSPQQWLLYSNQSTLY